MNLRSVSVFLGVTAVWLTAGVGSADAPFDVPADGGLPVCKAELETCDTELGVCTEDLLQTNMDLAGCTSDLGSCTADLGVCGSDLGICTADLVSCDDDLGTCNSSLGRCSSDLGACDAELATCASDLDQIKDDLDDCSMDLVACEASTVILPATGQTLCWSEAGEMIDCDVEAGEDGYFEAGGALAYVWHDDGVLEDVNTKLMWERKDMSGGVHDMRNTYRWVDTFREHVSALNNTCRSDEFVDCSVNGDADCAAALGEGEVCGFGGYRDWRVPNVKEMQSLIDYSANFPPVALAFNWMCGDGCTVADCSCTWTGTYWTSTSYVNTPDRAWFISNSGAVLNGWEYPSGTGFDAYKYDAMGVRAVRGGL